MAKIICIGEAMAEISKGDTDYNIGFAGDTLNTAIYCKRELGNKGDVEYITRIGHDPLSSSLLEFIASEEIATDAVIRDDAHQLGLYSITTDDEGERSFHYWRENSAARQMFQDPNCAELAKASTANIIYLSGISIAILSRAARANLLNNLLALKSLVDVKIAFDSNYRPKLWENIETARTTTEAFWRIADIALPSLDDEMALFGDAHSDAVMMRLENYGCKFGALKRGSEGPLPIGKCDVASLNFMAVDQVVDTTSAGDSFNGAFLAHHMMGKPIEGCLQAAHDLASKVIQFKGAIIPKDVN